MEDLVLRPLMPTTVQSKDSCVMSVFMHKGILDLVDAQWMCDSLSDDGIEIPEAFDLNIDDEINIRPGAPLADTDSPERWNDLGLDHFGHQPSY